MRGKNIIHKILLQLCVICSFACLIMKVLDWYNPYMDFIGHASFVEYILYVSIIMLALMEGVGKRRTRVC